MNFQSGLGSLRPWLLRLPHGGGGVVGQDVHQRCRQARSKASGHYGGGRELSRVSGFKSKER